MFHLEIDDRESRQARGGQDPRRGLDHALDRRDVDTRPVEHAAPGAEVVLHIDDQNGAPPAVDLDGLGLGIQDDRMGSGVHRRPPCPVGLENQVSFARPPSVTSEDNRTRSPGFVARG